MPDEAPIRRTLADKINHLFRTIYPAGRGEYSNAEVASRINEKGGTTISSAYIWQLRKGLKDNPTKKHLEALADFFGVSPIYFFDDAASARIDAELELLVLLRDSAIREIALRAQGLSPQFLSSVARMIWDARRMAGLPETEDAGATRAAKEPDQGRDESCDDLDNGPST